MDGYRADNERLLRHDARGTHGTTNVRTEDGLVARSLGLLVWLVVAVSIRLVGHVLLSPTTPILVFGSFVSVVPLMALVTYPVYHRFEIPRAKRESAAALMSLPGMFLDVLLVLFSGAVFPSMGRGAVINFGAILLFGYAVVLLTGLVPSGQRSG